MFSDPLKNITQMYIGEGMHVADFGAGVGFYTLAVAKRVGPHGKVYAIDIIADHLSKLKNEATRLGLKQIEVLHGNLETANGSGLKPESVDRVLIVNMLFQNEKPEIILEEAKRILKKKGRIAVIDWLDSFNMIGPHRDDLISKKHIIEQCAKIGLVLEKEFDAGSHHYGLLFKPQ